MSGIGECPKRHHSPRLRAGSWTCPDCEASTTASPLAAAFAARDRGMTLAATNRPVDNERVAAAIRQLAATGKPFSSNDARSIHGVRGGVVGATFNALRNEGLIRPVGEETSTDRGTHGKRVTTWISTAA